MAVPKKKISKSRRDMRRSHLALVAVNFVPCPNCGSEKLPHHVCASCGMYNGRRILAIKQAEEI
ncbi:MAG: 50S ribosomal protein L32 [Holosporaceae bacterium]|jgi:large subunit ribosomal protein L32|nr:50S ribosomal protein L32 [Holosporaceae bacterium]